MATVDAIAALSPPDRDSIELQQVVKRLRLGLRYSVNARIKGKPHVWIFAPARPGSPQLGEFPTARAAIQFLQPGDPR